jgi:putative ABC transport system ATP-binding protein
MSGGKVAILTSNLSKTYEISDEKIEVLKGVNLKVDEGEFVVIGGPSGSGKTTLLNIISSIDKPTGGTVNVLGNDLLVQKEDFLASFRCNNIGFVFQSYNLVSTLTVTENITFPMEWLRKSENEIKNRVEKLLEIMGLTSRGDHFPFQLSGGEQQRVAFARALANDPPLLLVDEPTGNLDLKTSQKIIQLLQSLKLDGKTIVVVSHDDRIIELADQKLCLEDGKLVTLNE